MDVFMVLKEMMGYRKGNRILNRWKDTPKSGRISFGLKNGPPYYGNRER